MTTVHHKFILTGLLLTLAGLELSAQKLPSTQEKSLLAPANVKIDGKPGEWNNWLQAHNRNANVDYTIANDKNNLYIVIQTKDPVIAKKILAGGITFRVNANGKKDSNRGVTVTYPIVKLDIKSQLGQLISERETATDLNAKNKQTDSLVRLMNTVMHSNIKEVKVTGVNAISDTLLSVYNTTGIKTGALFDSNRTLTCEVAIPLKYLDFLADNKTDLHYQITLNGLNSAETIYFRDPGPNGVVAVTSIPRSMSGGANSAISQVINFPTDFWGAYVLAK